MIRICLSVCLPLAHLPSLMPLLSLTHDPGLLGVDIQPCLCIEGPACAPSEPGNDGLGARVGHGDCQVAGACHLAAAVEVVISVGCASHHDLAIGSRDQGTHSIQAHAHSEGTCAGYREYQQTQ